MAARVDIAIVSLATTMGWRRADAALAAQIGAAGASCRVVPVTMGPAGGLRRTMALTDAVEAMAARHAAAGVRARATIYSSITAALLQNPTGPHAVRFDTTAALSRPGTGGAWQRRRERRVLGRADLLLPWSQASAQAASAAVGSSPPPTVVLPPPVDGPAAPAPDAPEAIAYAANPDKRGLDVLCEAWQSARPAGARLVVGGIDRVAAVAWLGRRRVPEPDAVEWAGAVDRERWLSLVAGARVFVSAARYEDWGLAQMEALAAGTPLVTVPTPGPNVALPLARALAPALVAGAAEAPALAEALRAGLGLDEAARTLYAGRAEELLAPYREESARAAVAAEVLPLLLRSSS